MLHQIRSSFVLVKRSDLDPAMLSLGASTQGAACCLQLLASFLVNGR